jgi:hypothetical protein
VSATPKTARLAGLAFVIVLTALAITVVRNPQPAVGADAPVPGMAGTDVSLPPTDSAVTVHGRGPFAGMEVTVNQTRDLTNQAVSVTWRGAAPTVAAGTKTFYGNFVQIMQCWGEPDTSVPENPGPPPEQCVWGALNPTASSEIPGFATNMVTSRAFTHETYADFDPSIGTVDASGEVFRDFVAVDGAIVKDHVDHTATGPFDQYWLNPYFNSVTSNELPGVRTLDDGRGQALMTVDTGVESRGLGCGQRVQPHAGGQPTVPRCWLVLVPRGLGDVENAGTPFVPSIGVATSPLRPAAWKNRIAVELQFTPVDSPCNIAAEQRQITGSEVAVSAVSSWQPVLCTQPGRLPYAYGIVSDALARQQLRSDVDGAPGMVAVNRPLAKGASTAEDPILYAPLAASAITVAFNVERVPWLSGTSDLRLQGVRFTDINLTPRLVAKLLTQSYRSQVEIGNSQPYTWDDGNPIYLLKDPDFLRFNPEFELWQAGSGRHAGGLMLPIGSSDLAVQVWEWILADPEAAAWLSGKADEWGMVVNPLYNTRAEANSSGVAFAAAPPDSFPKADPYCYQAPKLGSGVVPPPLCALDWMPYADGFVNAAHLTATANDLSKSALNIEAGLATDAWKRSGPQILGRRTILGLTDLSSSTNLGLQSAKLSRAGDDGAARQFVAPDSDGLGRAVQSMKDDDGMLRLDPDDVEPGAYPLTTLTYAAVRPFANDAGARADYAAFLDYAAGPGQVPGRKLGQLPPGYLPLPSALAQRTAAVADELRTLQPPEQPPTGTSTPPASDGAPPEQGTATDFGSGSGDGDTSTATDTDGAAAPNNNDAADSAQQVSKRTPLLRLGIGRYGVLALAVLALVAALAALEVTKRPFRRSRVEAPPPVATGSQP